ncbi:YrhB domain-containing protein, partial [Leptospira perdikensis]
NEYKHLKLKLTERNPTLRNNILIHSEIDALQKANDYLNQKSADLEDDEYIITKTEVKQYGWLVYFTNKKYVETNDDSFLLFGNGPFIINKYDASIFQIGSANPENQIYKYELEYFPDFVGSLEYVQNELTRILGMEDDIFLFDT